MFGWGHECDCCLVGAWQVRTWIDFHPTTYQLWDFGFERIPEALQRRIRAASLPEVRVVSSRPELFFGPHSPFSPFLSVSFCWFGGFNPKIDGKKSGCPYSNLSTGGPSSRLWTCWDWTTLVQPNNQSPICLANPRRE